MDVSRLAAYEDIRGSQKMVDDGGGASGGVGLCRLKSPRFPAAPIRVAALA